MHARRTASVVAIAALVATIASGCAAPRVVVVTTFPSRTATPAQTPTPTAFAIPPHLPGELGRSTATPTLVRLASVDLPRIRTLYLRVACSGASGTSVHYSLKPTSPTPSTTRLPFGPSGDVACTGEVTTTGFRSATPLPAGATVQLDPGAGVTAAYEILLRDAG